MYKRGEKFNVLSFDIVSQLVSNMLPQLDATFVINYLHNQASNDALTLDLVLPDDDVPFLDPSTFLAPASQLRIVKLYQNIRGKTSLRYDDRDYNMKYSRKLSRQSTWRCVSRSCTGKLIVETPTESAGLTKTDPGYYTVIRQQEHLSTCQPRSPSKLARSRVIRSTTSNTTHALAQQEGIAYSRSLRRARKRWMASESSTSSEATTSANATDEA